MVTGQYLNGHFCLSQVRAKYVEARAIRQNGTLSLYCMPTWGRLFLHSERTKNADEKDRSDPDNARMAEKRPDGV
jgi:hypothetical protein